MLGPDTSRSSSFHVGFIVKLTAISQMQFKDTSWSWENYGLKVRQHT